jgi:hypothetical protein
VEFRCIRMLSIQTQYLQNESSIYSYCIPNFLQFWYVTTLRARWFREADHSFRYSAKISWTESTVEAAKQLPYSVACQQILQLQYGKCHTSHRGVVVVVVATTVHTLKHVIVGCSTQHCRICTDWSVWEVFRKMLGDGRQKICDLLCACFCGSAKVSTVL